MNVFHWIALSTFWASRIFIEIVALFFAEVKNFLKKLRSLFFLDKVRRNRQNCLSPNCKDACITCNVTVNGVHIKKDVNVINLSRQDGDKQQHHEHDNRLFSLSWNWWHLIFCVVYDVNPACKGREKTWKKKSWNLRSLNRLPRKRRTR